VRNLVNLAVIDNYFGQLAGKDVKISVNILLLEPNVPRHNLYTILADKWITGGVRK
jgi:hypothetical protein